MITLNLQFFGNGKSGGEGRQLLRRQCPPRSRLPRRPSNMDFSFDFSSLDFSMNRPEEETDEVGEFLRSAKINKKPVMYENALKMAADLDLNQDYFCIIGGAFIYGDFIEALCDRKNLNPKRINVTTLGMGKENIDSLINCLDYLGTKQINLIVSTYWAGVERQGLRMKSRCHGSNEGINE